MDQVKKEESDGLLKDGNTTPLPSYMLQTVKKQQYMLQLPTETNKNDQTFNSIDAHSPLGTHQNLDEGGDPEPLITEEMDQSVKDPWSPQQSSQLIRD